MLATKARRAAGWFILLVLGYLALIDQITVEEVIAAFVCALVIAAFALRLEHIAAVVPLPPLRGVANLVVRTPWALIEETWFLLGVVLWRSIVLRREVPGRWIALRYDLESETDDAGRRAIVVLGSSISPNAIPLSIDRANGQLILHQVYARREPGANDPRYPF